MLWFGIDIVLTLRYNNTDMAFSPNIFARYVWLLDTLRSYGRLSFEQISNLWSKSGLGFGEDLPLRTFHNHRQAISDIFDIEIACEARGKNSRYYIEGAERLTGDSFCGWLLDCLAVGNKITDVQHLERRVGVEETPSGRVWFTVLMDAIKANRIVEIAYKGYV